MADKREPDEAELELFFQAARSDMPEPSAALYERVLRDAAATQAAAAAGRRPGRARRGGPAGLLAALGGWPSLAGLATAAITGLMIGFAAPDAVDTLSGGVLAGGGYDLDDLMPSYGDLLAEG